MCTLPSQPNCTVVYVVLDHVTKYMYPNGRLPDDKAT